MFPFRDHNPSGATPVVTWALILINTLVHVAQAAAVQGDAALWRLYDDWALIPAEISRGEGLVTLVTMGFLHAGWLHLAGNMLFLRVFGDNLEATLGRVGFLAFYLLGGVGAGLAQWAANPASPVPTIGASGAVAAVMGGYLLLFPRARIDVLLVLVVLLRVVPLPAWLVLLAWFGLQLLGGIEADPVAGGVAYWAHVGGFVAGLALGLPAWLRRGGSRWWDRTRGEPPHPPAEGPWNGPSPTRIPRVPRR